MNLLKERKKMKINRLALRAFYESHRDEYLRRRFSGDKALWDESYKWDILPRLNKELAAYDSVNGDSIAEIAHIVTHHTNTSNFANWRDIDDLKDLLSRRNAHSVLSELWLAKPETAAKCIQTASQLAQLFMSDKSFAPSTWAYLLAALDCNSFALYREAIMKQVAEICGVDSPTAASQGEKYTLLNDAALYLGELMRGDINDVPYMQALNGQDFLWVTLEYSDS